MGGIPEVVEDNESALLVPAGNSEAVAGALDRLLNDAELRQRLGTAAQTRASELFSTAGVVPQYEALYRRVLSTR